MEVIETFTNAYLSNPSFWLVINLLLGLLLLGAYLTLKIMVHFMQYSPELIPADDKSLNKMYRAKFAKEADVRHAKYFDDEFTQFKLRNKK